MRETKWWTWHIVAGVVILVFLTLHMLIMHLDDIIGVFNPNAGGALAWENVIARSQTTFFAITYIVLLGAALYHGLYGARTILFELSLKPGLRRLVTVVFWVGGLALFVIGTWAAIAVKMKDFGA
jgi:succinate dehydrogenase / fumarate reductase membrane anchor subunit